MDRTGKIGVAIAIITLVVWQIFYSKQMEVARLAQEQAALIAGALAPQTEPPSTASASPAVASGSPQTVGGASPVSSESSVPAAAASIPKRLETLNQAQGKWIFTNFGGGIDHVELSHHKAEGGGDLILNEFGGIPIGALTEGFESSVLEPFEMEMNSERNAVLFHRVDGRQLLMEKRFTFPAATQSKEGAEVFSAEMEVRFVNQSAAPLTVPAYAVRTGSVAPLHINDQTIYTGFNRMTAGATKFTDVHWFEGGGFLGFNKVPRPVYAESVPVQWAAVTNQYYSTILTPVGDLATEALARRFQVGVQEWQAGGRDGAGTAPIAVDGALRFGASVLEPGKELVRKFTIYAGPREHWRLQQMGGGQEQLLEFGTFGFVSKILLSSMTWLKSMLGSYAWAIIALTIIIKALMWPLQNKSTASMQRMQELQPKMNALKEKYGDDPTRMNQELLGLYKKHGVNPMAGCLPMLVQIPIFFGFYNMLGKAVELRNSPFLWVKDLSQPDTVAVLLGFPVNVLPILMAGTMLYQMRLTPKTGDPMQQRMFMFMPVIFVVFCYNYASGLALYWTVQNLFTIGQLLITNRKGSQSLQVTPAGGK